METTTAQGCSDACYAHRVDVLREELERVGAEGAFFPQGAELEYLTGIRRAGHIHDVAADPELAVEGCFVGLRREPIVIVTHSEWSLSVSSSAHRYEVWHMPSHDDPVDWLRRGIAATGVVRELRVPGRTTMDQLAVLKQARPGMRVESVGAVVTTMREAKDSHEIGCIRAAAELALGALATTVSRLVGEQSFRRRDLLDDLERDMRRLGSERLALAPDLFAAGPTTEVGWRSASTGQDSELIARPAAVSIDFGAVINGYRSDVGRTIFFGQPSKHATRALEAVRDASRAALSAIYPGVRAEEVDGAARAVLEDRGLGHAFTIPSGHGLGLETHELPRLRRGSAERIRDHAVLAVEVAAWEPGHVSAFWEEDILATDSGAMLLSDRLDTPLVVE